MDSLAKIADKALERTKIFHCYGTNQDPPPIPKREKGEHYDEEEGEDSFLFPKLYAIDTLQNGAIRSNCVDSLDRTNAAQFCIGNFYFYFYFFIFIFYFYFLFLFLFKIIFFLLFLFIQERLFCS